MPGTSFNLCNLPPWVIASRHFVDNPQPIEIQGVREGNRFLFRTLDAIEDPEERARRFDDYLSVKFQLHHWAQQATDGARRSIKNSYLRFLRGWGVDSSSLEGAVLKGWVESRLGIPPELPPRAHPRRRARGLRPLRVSTAIRGQRADERHLRPSSTCSTPSTSTSSRGGCPGSGGSRSTAARTTSPTTRCSRSSAGREAWVRLNNLCSFTDDRERAWEFGSTVWEARIPLPRIFFASELLPRSILKGEREYLVVGGRDACVRTLLS